MKKLHCAIVIGIMTMFVPDLCGQMTYTNLEWVDRSPVVGDSIFHSSTIVVSGKTYVTSNKVNGSGNTDIFTIKIDSNGDTLWSMMYNGSATGSMDYGVELKYASGYIWVVGAAKNTSTDYDYCILKYNATNGSLAYSNNWNGAGNGMDIPTSLHVESNGSAVYVCGGSEATNGFSDMAVIKLNFGPGSGWTKYYNYANLHDGASAIKSTGTNVVVTGGSAASVGDWDLATLTIHKLTGSMSSTRTNIFGATMVEANAMTTDSLNNVYITGYAIVGGEKNTQTIKLDSNLTLNWIKEYNLALDQEGNDIGVDDAGNVYVTGYTELGSGGNNCLTLKYNASGTEKFAVQYGNYDGLENAFAERMCVTPEGNLFISGTVENISGVKMILLKYNSTGQLKMLQEYQSDDIDYDVYDIDLYGTEVFITGLSHRVDTVQLTVLKYEVVDRIMELSGDTTDNPHIENSVIIRFDSEVMNQTIIDNKQVTTGVLSEFVDSTTISNMTDVTNIDCSKLRTFKVFRQMTTGDTISITRLGDSINIGPLWATLVVYLDPINGEELFIDSIETLDAVMFAEKDYVSETYSVPNDTWYSNYQESLKPTGIYSNADINCEPAWDIEVGQPYTRVAVIDHPIYYGHPDFAGGGGVGGSKIMDGWDFVNNIPISAVTNPESHGTSVAGIIGAVRNNGTGIAGIAGGDFENGNTGAHFVSLGIFEGYYDPTANSIVSEAIVMASVDNPSTGYGYGAHILNNSYGSDAFSIIVAEAVYVSWRNQTVFVGSRGNNNLDAYAYPACLEDIQVLNITASGTDGRWKNTGNGDGYTAGFDHGIDVIAPGTTQIVNSTIYSGNPYGFSGCIPDPNYECFTGTSSATPHVSGVSALMYSHHNTENGFPNNLALQDVEYFLENSAVENDLLPGYDEYNGFGLIDATASMMMIQWPYFYVKHINDSPVTVQFQGNDDIWINPPNGQGFDIPTGHYNAELYKVSWNFVELLPSNHEILDYWILESATFRGVNNIPGGSDIPYMYINSSITIGDNVAIVSAHTYTYYVQGGIFPTYNVINDWYPYSPDELSLTYSLYVQSNTDVGIEENLNEDLTLYPNPTENIVNLQFEISQDSEVRIEIYNAQGEMVVNSDLGSFEKGQVNISLGTTNLAVGIYLCKLTVGNNIVTTNFVRQ